MRIAYITAGAAGMYCGSCMRDNTLVTALLGLGHDAQLIPTYTPIQTDEPSVSQPRVFFGGLNVYLQQKLGLFRYTPWLFDRLLDAPKLLRWIAKFAVKTQASDLGDLTISVLKGSVGHQRKEIDKLVQWFRASPKPDVIVLTNVLLSGLAPELHKQLQVPIVGTLQGDDIFLEALPQRFRDEALALIRQNCSAIAGYLVTCRAYAEFMAQYLGLPRDQMHVVYPGLKLGEQPVPRACEPGSLPTIGYFARICPEKGLHTLVEAYGILRKQLGLSAGKLRISGWLGAQNQPYLAAQLKKLTDLGLGSEVEQVECPDQRSKLAFLRSLDVFSVPTSYREPKGLYVLEALAQGVPVVQPEHGSFPELLAMTEGGLLVRPDDPASLAQGLYELCLHPERRRALGARGQERVYQHFHAARMAQETVQVLEPFTHRA